MVISPLAAPYCIFVKRVFITKEDIMNQSVMKTVSGPSQLCHAKVIQTINETPKVVFCSNMNF